MKSKILSAIILLVVVSGLTKNASAATLNNSNVTVLNDVSAINKIEVHGNVELFISDGATDQVKVYNKYYSESALVQSKNGVLRITSYNAEKLVIWVKANDLRSVSAFDNAEVRTFGNVSKIEFNIDLHNNATAKLNLDAFATNLIVKDHAKAELNGASTELNLSQATGTTVSKTGFAVINFTENKNITNAAVKADDDMIGI